MFVVNHRDDIVPPVLTGEREQRCRIDTLRMFAMLRPIAAHIGSWELTGQGTLGLIGCFPEPKSKIRSDSLPHSPCMVFLYPVFAS